MRGEPSGCPSMWCGVRRIERGWEGREGLPEGGFSRDGSKQVSKVLEGRRYVRIASEEGSGGTL